MNEFIIDVTKCQIIPHRNDMMVWLSGEFELNIYIWWGERNDQVSHLELSYEARRGYSEHEVLRELIEHIFNGRFAHKERHHYDPNGGGPSIQLSEHMHKKWHLGNMPENLRDVFIQLIDSRNVWEPSQELIEKL